MIVPEASASISFIRRSWLYLFVIIAAYALAAALFAVRTPEWQNPDEPAHYNNIAHIASGAGLPVLRAGDYNEYYLRALVDAVAKRAPTTG